MSHDRGSLATAGMPIYQYICTSAPLAGNFEAWQPAGRAAEPLPCPACGDNAPRRYAAPNLRRTPSPLEAVIQHSERGAYERQVVSSPLAGGVHSAETHIITGGGPGSAAEAACRSRADLPGRRANAMVSGSCCPSHADSAATRERS